MRLTKTQITALQAVERGAVWDEEHAEYFQLQTGGARAHTIFDLEGDGLVKRGQRKKWRRSQSIAIPSPTPDALLLRRRGNEQRTQAHDRR